MKLTKIAAGILMAATLTASSLALAADRPRDMGIEIGVLHPGANNAITDVKGVLVGQVTLVDEKKGMHTGVLTRTISLRTRCPLVFSLPMLSAR